jgi:myosin-6
MALMKEILISKYIFICVCFVCSDLIESKNGGIFNLLDEESKLPKQSSEHFTTEVHKRWQGHFRLALARASRLKIHREIRDDEGFMVRHFAGAVCYQTVSI